MILFFLSTKKQRLRKLSEEEIESRVEAAGFDKVSEASLFSC